MIIIYTQDRTYIHKDLETAMPDIRKLYGEKLSAETYTKLSNAPSGTTFRMHGGPLVKVVDKAEADKARVKETAIGMM